MINDTEQIGVLNISEAIEMATNQGLDLVEVSPNAKPPVCKIIDYGKYRYQQNKKARENKKATAKVVVQEIRMKVRIGSHDLEIKAKNARKFLQSGSKVRVSVMFRAREITHPEVGEELLAWFFEQLEDVAEQERKAGMEGRFMTMTLEPIRKAPSKKAEPVG